MMSKLILHPTEVSQWHALVYDAQASTHLILDINTESYLVFLLMRFIHSSKLLESIVALDFLHSFQATPTRQIELLKEVGDKSLLFCGLFPGMAEKRHLSLNYFIEMGQGAYLTVSELQERELADLYYELSTQFINMQNILQALRVGIFAQDQVVENNIVTSIASKE
jgi:hypothetical protein